MSATDKRLSGAEIERRMSYLNSTAELAGLSLHQLPNLSLIHI